MLVLHIKKKWFDMILSKKKTEEYREIKPYYITRFKNILKDSFKRRLLLSDEQFIKVLTFTISLPFTVKFINGYGNNRPYIIAEVRLTVDEGYEDWGAEPGLEYFVLIIDRIKKTGNLENCYTKEES
ncbi:MAG: ASCH domain-containing protein [Eubacterium sp.]|nr:ASCH domain-containing protein [Eubacterium sp.]